MFNEGATHVAVATDHVIESFRNELWATTRRAKESSQTASRNSLCSKTLSSAAGIVDWPMVEFEADDALAAAAALAANDPRVERVIICTPDKDLAQCVRGTRIVQLDRRKRITRDEAGVIAKFGVPPRSIPDYLALVGDSSDGYPGLPGWGAEILCRCARQVSSTSKPSRGLREWHVNAANAGALAATLARERDTALLFRKLATLRTDIPLFKNVDELRWRRHHARLCGFQVEFRLRCHRTAEVVPAPVAHHGATIRRIHTIPPASDAVVLNNQVPVTPAIHVSILRDTVRGKVLPQLWREANYG